MKRLKQMIFKELDPDYKLNALIIDGIVSIEKIPECEANAKRIFSWLTLTDLANLLRCIEIIKMWIKVEMETRK